MANVRQLWHEGALRNTARFHPQVGSDVVRGEGAAPSPAFA